MSTESELALYDKALVKWGKETQVGMLMEECGALIAAAHQWIQGRAGVDKLIEEMVDVDLMLNQIRQVINEERLWRYWHSRKLARLAILLGIEPEVLPQ